MKKKKQTFLWKISHNEQNSYLFGTMHVRDKRAFGALPILEEKINECEVFAAEFNLDDADAGQMNYHTLLPENQLLENLFKPKRYHALSTLFYKQTGMDISLLNNQKPFFVYQLLTETLFKEDMPFALDRYLYEHAKEQNKTLTGVETFAEQIAILNNISIQEQTTILNQTVRNFKKYRRQLKKLTDLYQSGNLSQLNKSARKSMGKLRKMMIDDRNFIMADRIAKMTSQQTAFVAVGAGHLGGKKGVLRLLKLKDIKLKPISTN